MNNKLSSKQNLRSYFSSIRKTVGKEQAQEFSERAAENFLSNFKFSENTVVGLFYPSYSEISTEPLAIKLAERGIKTCLPVVVGKDKPLIFHKWQHGDKTSKGKFFDIQEPLLDTEEVSPTILLAPCLAFDNNGYRLGYGGGFYDRAILHLKQFDIIIVTYAYSCQEADYIPIESFDQKADFVVTESYCKKFP